MKENKQHHDDSPLFPEKEIDELSKLLSVDAKIHPVEESPWFSARVTARAYETPQQRGFFSFQGGPLRHFRWVLPLPLAGIAAACILLLQHASFNPHSRTFSSSEAEFEQHMEMFASNDFSL